MTYPHTLPRYRRKESESHQNSIEQFHFQSVNGSLGFLGMCVRPFACFAASHLQQTDGPSTVTNMVKQGSLIKSVQSMGSYSVYRRPAKGKHKISVVVFADAGKPSTNAQQGFIAGLMFGPHKFGSIIHTLQWNSHVSQRPVKSIASGEVHAASEGVDEGKFISKTFSKLLGRHVPLTVLVDSKDRFTSLSTCRVPEDKSIRADLELLRYYYETEQLRQIIWIPGSTNLADLLTKIDSPLSPVLQLMLFDGTIQMGLDRAQVRDSRASLG